MAKDSLTRGKGLGTKPAEKRRSVYVMVCAGIDHIATDPHTPREDRVRELWMIMHRCQNLVAEYLAEAVCGAPPPPKPRRHQS
jgi:hypothetical protein